MDSPKRIAIIGGGITGLTAAWRLQQNGLGRSVSLFEASGRLGGLIQTTIRDGFLIEHSADSFLTSDAVPWARDLCQQLELELIPTSSEHRGALILREGTFYPIPEGLHLMNLKRLGPLLASPLLSWQGKLRVACERFVPRRKRTDDESLIDFATRRFGREMFERIIQPLVGGIYTADPHQLSVSAALPQFVEMERKYGRLTIDPDAGTATSERGARYSLFRAPAGGMHAIIDELARKLDTIDLRRNSPLSSVSRSNNQWSLQGPNTEAELFDAVIVAVPAPVAGKLLAPVDGELPNAISSIEHVTTAVVCCGYQRQQIRHPLDAFGCIVPSVENRKLLAASFASVKFPDRAPNDHVLIRGFVGGALQSEYAELPDDVLGSLVRSELAELLSIEGEPCLQQIVRWPTTTPQYNLGHADRLATIDQARKRLPGLSIAGNAYLGVGIPQCVRGGWEAADEAAQFIGSRDV